VANETKMVILTPHVHVFHIDDGADSHPGGSNNYFVGDPKEEMLLIDTGDHKRVWTDALLQAWRDLGSPKITAILITHGHADHYGGLDRVWDAMHAPVRAHPKMSKILKDLVPEDALKPLKNNEVLRTGGGVSLKAIFTPGHAIDHTCFYFAKEKVLFTGDTILGSSSATMSDLKSYMKSLEKLSHLGHESIASAHGALIPAPRGKRLVQVYIGHRTEREQQVVASLQKGLSTVDEMLKDIYPKNLKKGLRESAKRNIRNHLDKLMKEGKVAESQPTYALGSASAKKAASKNGAGRANGKAPAKAKASAGKK